MNTRFKENVQKLFEYWCEISPTAIGEKVSGVIVESFPERFKDPEIITKIPEFAYPCQFLNESVQTYSFVLTSTDSKWRFGFCRHDAKAQTAMVIITYLPWHDTFLKFLNVLGEMKRTSKNDFQPFLAEAYAKGVPEPGACLKLFYNSGLNSFIFQRPSQFQLPSIPENHNLNLYYNFVDPKNMIAVFSAMLAERRIIFTSQRLDRLSSSVQAAHAFLYPMVWQHIFIPILPLKMKEILCAPMPYLIGVPEAVLETMTREELGEVVILNCDNKFFESPFDDVKNMPAELVSQLKKQLSNQHDHIGDRVSKIFLGVLVQLIGGYRDAIKFSQGSKLTWCRETFIDSRPSHLRPFLRNMLELQIFQQFIEERLEMLNTGLGFSDEFELETLRHHEKPRRRIKPFLRNVKDKTNPAVKSAVQSVKQGGRGVKTAYKDLKLKLSERTPSKGSSSSRSVSVASASSAGYQHHSAPNSPAKSELLTDLIELDSREASFEVDDFDPLNQNAKQIPAVPKRSTVILPQIPSSMPPSKGVAQPTPPPPPPQSRSQAFSNPMYPYFIPSYMQKAAIPANTMNNTKIDDDIELLRKYGLDRFKLNSKSTVSSNDTINTFTTLASGNPNANRTNGTNGLQLNGGDLQPKTNKNWTTFE
ncbi:DENN domain-containing protein 1A isoform X5 [Contarinia nasturtii]|uniref:DENN domain-containing protein 1A isoform X5 n=1 Tax=Contarinia nasturtii TaxID=265458 RepID=UPI0012D3D939|nr:DENN domain-containing protein 1A isoform X5 [Contarinia nasturtii]